MNILDRLEAKKEYFYKPLCYTEILLIPKDRYELINVMNIHENYFNDIFYYKDIPVPYDKAMNIGSCIRISPYSDLSYPKNIPL